MATCKKCGQEIDKGVKFCPSCGTAVQQAAPKETAEKKPVNCANCGKKLPDGVKFCPSCGTAVSGKSVKAEAQNQEIQQADPADAEQNKGMAVVAYILFFIPLITGDHKKSPFVMFHTNQGTVLFITCIAVSIASSILMGILTAALSWSAIFIVIIGAILWPLVSIALFVLFIIGIINALKGRMKPLPIIGKFVIIK